MEDQYFWHKLLFVNFIKFLLFYTNQKVLNKRLILEDLIANDIDVTRNCNIKYNLKTQASNLIIIYNKVNIDSTWSHYIHEYILIVSHLRIQMIISF